MGPNSGDVEGVPAELLTGFVPAWACSTDRPIELWVDTTNKCNVRCIMCHFAYDSVWKSPMVQWSPAFLSRIESELLPHVGIAHLSLGTEPLVWTGFPLLLESVRRAGVPVIEMYTNGLLLTEEIARRIVETPVGRVKFSLEAASAQGFESVRLGGRFECFVRNIEMLVRARERAGSRLPRLQFNVTLLRRAASEVEDILRLAARLGVEDLDLRHVIVHDGLGMEQDSFFEAKAGFNRLMSRVRDLARELGLRIVTAPDDFAVPAPEEGALLRDPKEKPVCRAPWKQVFVRSDGTVVPCPFWYTAEVMGDLRKQSFLDVWEGPSFRRLRWELLTGQYGINCLKCPLRGIGRVDDASAHRSHVAEKRGESLGPSVSAPKPDPQALAQSRGSSRG